MLGEIIFFQFDVTVFESRPPQLALLSFYHCRLKRTPVLLRPGRAAKCEVSLSSCLSIRSCIAKTIWPNFMKISVRATWGRGLVISWRQCKTLCTFDLWMTSRFHIMAQIQIQALANYSPWLARWRRGEVCYRRLPCFCLFPPCYCCALYCSTLPLYYLNWD